MRPAGEESYVKPDPWLRSRRDSFDEWLKVYEPSWVSARDSVRSTALLGAVGNPDAEARVAISNRLLDDGADPRVQSLSSTVLHNLFSQKNLDPVADVALLRRLLDGGADINRSVTKFGRPLSVLRFYGSTKSFERGARDRMLAAFYDVIFERPDVDLVGVVRRTGRPYAQLLLKDPAFRVAGDLEARVRAYLTAQGHDPDVVLDGLNDGLTPQQLARIDEGRSAK